MSKTVVTSILQVPIEFLYRILDDLDEFTLLCSMHDVCTRLNMIMDTYHRWKVNSQLALSHEIFFVKKAILTIDFVNFWFVEAMSDIT